MTASSTPSSPRPHPNPHIRAFRLRQPLTRSIPARAYGLGARVPMLIVSPWSKGGWVCSQTFDHTSVIQFIEKRFGVQEPHITPWRRAISGDLTSALNFKTADRSKIDLPDTTNFISFV